MFGKKKFVHAVNDVSFDIMPGETFSLVGESGCGKSTTGKLIDHLITPDTGEIWFEGKDISKISDNEMRPLRSDIQMVFQDPYGSLNPRMKVQDLIGEPLLIHTNMTAGERLKKVHELLGVVGLSPSHGERYPHEFSGGQRQRIGIARALTVQPKLIIADEPVSALDVSIQAQVLNLLQNLQKEYNLTYLFISHDLSVVEMISDRIGVMYLGTIVETAPKKSFTQIRDIHIQERFFQQFRSRILTRSPNVLFCRGIFQVQVIHQADVCSIHAARTVQKNVKQSVLLR